MSHVYNVTDLEKINVLCVIVIHHCSVELVGVKIAFTQHPMRQIDNHVTKPEPNAMEAQKPSVQNEIMEQI